MTQPEFCNFAAYKELKRLSREMNQDHKHLKNLIQDPERLTRFSIQADHFF